MSSIRLLLKITRPGADISLDMVQDRRDHRTQDLLDWQPPAVTQRFPEEKVRASDGQGLKECGCPRGRRQAVAAPPLALLNLNRHVKIVA